MFNIKRSLGAEVWSASALHNSAWPDSDPSNGAQPEARWDQSHSELLQRAVENVEFTPRIFWTRTAGMKTADRLWGLLTHRAFNFNGSSVRAEGHWVERVRGGVSRGERIQIAYPLVCKIGNPAKRMTLVGITAGERATVRFFKRLGELAREVYSPGIVINVLSDATLYNGALQVPPPSAYAYMKEFGALVEEEDAGDTVKMHDYSELLSPFYREFEIAYGRPTPIWTRRPTSRSMSRRDPRCRRASGRASTPAALAWISRACAASSGRAKWTSSQPGACWTLRRSSPFASSWRSSWRATG